MSLKRRVLLSGALAAPLAAPSLRVARAAEPVSFLAPAPPSLPAFAPQQIALARGYFAANGLTVSFRIARGGADAAKQIAVGNGDFGGGVGETSMIVRANGLPVRGVILLGSRPIFHVSVRRSVAAKSLADLRGKKVGVLSYEDTSYYALLGVLAASGLKRSDLQIEAVGPAGITQLMIAGSLDAIMDVPEWADDIESAGIQLDRFAIDDAFPAMAQAVLASDQTIRQRPDMVRGFVHAVRQGMLDCMQDPEKAAHDFCAAVPQQAGKEAQMARVIGHYAKDVYATNPMSKLGDFDPARLRTVQKFYLDNNIVQRAVPIDELYTNEFLA